MSASRESSAGVSVPSCIKAPPVNLTNSSVSLIIRRRSAMAGAVGNTFSSAVSTVRACRFTVVRCTPNIRPTILGRRFVRFWNITMNTA